MDFIQIIFGRFFLEFLGALIRWVYLNILGFFITDDYVSFSKLWSPKGSVKKRDKNSELNHMLGVIIFCLFIVSLVFL